MKSHRIRLSVMVMTICASAWSSRSAAEESKAETKPATQAAGDSLHWQFLETPSKKSSSTTQTKKTATRPSVSGGGQAWKSRLRR